MREFTHEFSGKKNDLVQTLIRVMDIIFCSRYFKAGKLCAGFLLCLLFSGGLLFGQQNGTVQSSTEGTVITYGTDKKSLNTLLDEAKGAVNDNPDSALLLLQKLLFLCNTEELRYQQTKAFAFIAISYMRKGQYKQSQAFLDMAFKNAHLLKDKDMLAFLHNINAINYQQTGSYGSSISHYLQALDLIKDGIGEDRTNQTYINFGGFWSTLGENRQALKYFMLAKDLKLNGNQRDPYILMNMGIAYVDSNKDLAIQKFNEALHVLTANKDLYLTHKLYLNLSLIYGMKDRMDSALYYLQNADSLTAILNTDLALAIFQAHAGGVYHNMKDYRRAKAYLESSLALSQKIGLKDGVKNLHEELSQIYKAEGNFERAYYHQTYSIAYQDSIQRNEKNKTIDLMLDYQRAEKDRLLGQKQLQLTMKENEVEQRNTWIVSILIAGFCLIAIFFYAYRNSKNKQKLQHGELTLLKQKREIEKLQALAAGEENERNRIAHELHDSVMIGFAAVKMQLNALPNQFPVLNGAAAHQQVLKQLDKATAELRRTAHNLMPDVLLDEGIVQAVYYFCRNIQETSGLHISFQHVGDQLPRFNMEFEISFYRIVQELLQNVIKHAEATKALVQITHGRDYLSLTIEDNGKGFLPAATTEGLGLKSIRNKLTVFNCSFDIKSIPGNSTTIYIECPVSSLLLMKQ